MPAGIVAAQKAERASLLAEARSLVDNPRATNSETARATALIDRADAIASLIRTQERAAGFAAALDAETNKEPAGSVIGANISSTRANELRLIRALGSRPVERAEGSAPDPDRLEIARRYSQPVAADGTTPGTAGGFLVAPILFNELLLAMKSQSSVASVANVFTTATGASLRVPEVNDLAQSGRLLPTENTQLNTATDILFAGAVFSAFTYTSDILLVSNELMQDSAFDFGALMLKTLGGRLGRATNPHYTTGTGSGQPQGVVTGAAAGPVLPNGSTVSVTYNNLVDLIHSVDPAYRVGASFMLHDTTLQAIRKITDTAGRPVFVPFMLPGATSTSGGLLLGYPVGINQDMAPMAAGAKSILFGDFSSYMIRVVVDLRLQPLKERYADYNQTAFVASIRTDAKLTSAAQPVRYLQNSAT